MRVRVVALICLLGVASPIGLARAAVHLGVSPFGAFAETSLRINSHEAYLIGFTVLREVIPETSRLELISEASRCDVITEACTDVTEQTDPLPMSALHVSGNKRSATLRTRWAGLPIVVTWTARGIVQTGTVLTTTNGPHTQVWADGYTKVYGDLTEVRFLGRVCKAVDGLIYTSGAGVASDYTVSGSSGLPRADTLRSKLVATRGSCFNPQPV